MPGYSNNDNQKKMIEIGIEHAVTEYQRIISKYVLKGEIKELKVRVEPLKKIAGKGYSMKQEFGFFFDDGEIIEGAPLYKPLFFMTVIGMKKEEGTGNLDSYKFEDVADVHSELKKYGLSPSNMKAAYMPREKPADGLEVVLPIGSTYNGKFFPFLVSLTELSLKGKEIYPIFQIGQSQRIYESMIKSPIEGLYRAQPRFEFTTCHTRTGKKIGNPHCLVNFSKETQFAGFITLKTEDYMSDIFDEIGSMPQEIK